MKILYATRFSKNDHVHVATSPFVVEKNPDCCHDTGYWHIYDVPYRFKDDKEPVGGTEGICKAGFRRLTGRLPRVGRVLKLQVKAF